jgi:DNA-directed RNA polymerase subunit RPC12/RpoP
MAAAVQAGLGQGVPAPCTRCGAPMIITPPQFLHQDPELGCQYCGHREVLPKDAAERHRHLRLRLLQVSRAREAGEAPLQTFKMMNDAWAPSLFMMGALGLYQSYGFLSNWETSIKPAPQQALFGGVPLAIAFGMVTGFLGMRHVYRRRLEPLLLARPAQAPGLAVRCRNCGGDLPPVRAPQITCPHCSASNLLDHSLTANAGRLLEQEALAYQQRLAPWTRDANVYRAPLRAFYLFGGIGAATALLVIGGTLLLLARIS